MDIQIRIKTPKGHATKIEGKIRFFLLGNKAQKLQVQKNKDDSEINWLITGDPRKLNKIIRNVALYDTIMSRMLEHKVTKKAIKKHLDLEGQAELQEMLLNQTTVEVVKGRTPDINKEKKTNRLSRK